MPAAVEVSLESLGGGAAPIEIICPEQSRKQSTAQDLSIKLVLAVFFSRV
jgi:hypothetical protein